MKLEFEILPSGAFGNNLRNILSKKAWNYLRQVVIERHDGKCAICGRKPKRLECHERWEFNKEEKIQRLIEIVPLCSLCHSTIHIQRSILVGIDDKCVKHFEKINNCDYQGFVKELKEKTDLANSLSSVDEWSLNLEKLKDYVEIQ